MNIPEQTLLEDIERQIKCLKEVAKQHGDHEDAFIRGWNYGWNSASSFVCARLEDMLVSYKKTKKFYESKEL